MNYGLWGTSGMGWGSCNAYGDQFEVPRGHRITDDFPKRTFFLQNARGDALGITTDTNPQRMAYRIDGNPKSRRSSTFGVTNG